MIDIAKITETQKLTWELEIETDGIETVARRYKMSIAEIERMMNGHVYRNSKVGAEMQAEIVRLCTEDGLTNKEISKTLGIHPNTTAKYLRGVKSKKRNFSWETNLWPEEETRYVVDYYHTSTLMELAYALDKTKNQVISRVATLQSVGILELKYPKG